jgi:D-psicose/D-tagatose/L-ribulose 3-epimerase
MQALLYGTKGLNLFGDAETRQALLSHLDAVCRMGAVLGATRLVFGSPRNRDRSALSDGSTQAIADAFFRRLGDLAAGHGVLICLEPNPACYGANFMTNSAETAAVVRSVAHPAIRMQFDTGAISINREDPSATLKMCADLVGHIHLSEPNLVPLGDCHTDHATIAEGLALHLPNHVATVEMLVTKNEAHESSIARGLRAALRYYS